MCGSARSRWVPRSHDRAAGASLAWRSARRGAAMHRQGSHYNRREKLMHVFHRAVLGIVALAALVLSSAVFADSFVATGALGTARYGAFAARLPDGRVLVAGGFNGSSLASGEIYDP